MDSAKVQPPVAAGSNIHTIITKWYFTPTQLHHHRIPPSNQVQQDARVQKLLKAAARDDFTMDPRGVSNVGWGLARMKVQDPAVWSQVQRQGLEQARGGIQAPEAQARPLLVPMMDLATSNVAAAGGVLFALANLAAGKVKELGEEGGTLLSIEARRGIESDVKLMQAGRLGAALVSDLWLASSLLRGLARLSATKVNELVQDGGDVVWALAEASVLADMQRMDAFTRRDYKDKAKGFKAQEISLLLWALAVSHVAVEQELVRALSRAAVARADDFKPQEMANMTWALATMKERPSEELVTALSRVAVGKKADFSPQAIANLLWAFATLSIKPSPSLVEAMSAEAVRLSEHFIPQDISNLMWAYATLGCDITPELATHMAKAATARADAFKPQNVSNLLWSFATLRITPDAEMVQALTKVVAARAKQFKPQELANTWWALATLGAHAEMEGPLSVAVSEAMAKKVGDFKARELSTMMWGFATARLKPDAKLVESVAEAALRLVSTEKAPNSSFDDFDTHSITMLLWSLAKCGVLEDQVPLCEALLRAAEERIDTLDVRHIANIAWALATARVAPDFADAVWLRAEQLCYERGPNGFKPQEVLRAYSFSSDMVAPPCHHTFYPLHLTLHSFAKLHTGFQFDVGCGHCFHPDSPFPRRRAGHTLCPLFGVV
jgi:hypothetical protein